MNLITPQFSAGLSFVIGARHIHQELLDAVAHMSLRGPVRVLDGGNSFNAYQVARALRRHSPDLAGLERIQLARAFTCYQMLALLESTPQYALPTLVLDMLTTFYDENVPLRECQRLLEASLAHLQRLSRAAPVLVNASWPKAIASERAQLVEAIEQIADQVYYLEEPAPRLPARLF
jgi:hypothetical protein